MTTPEQITSCCAVAYSSDAVALPLGDSYHPGGAALTRRLAGVLGLRPGLRVADIASGPGATVDGVDYAAAIVAAAREAAEAASPRHNRAAVGHHPRPLARHPRERTHGVEVEVEETS